MKIELMALNTIVRPEDVNFSLNHNTNTNGVTVRSNRKRCRLYVNEERPPPLSIFSSTSLLKVADPLISRDTYI